MNKLRLRELYCSYLVDRFKQELQKIFTAFDFDNEMGWICANKSLKWEEALYKTLRKAGLKKEYDYYLSLNYSEALEYSQLIIELAKEYGVIKNTKGEK